MEKLSHGRSQSGHAADYSGPARNFADIVQAARLCYRVYRDSGYCGANGSGLRLSNFDLLPSATTFVIGNGSELLGAFTGLLDSPHGLAADAAFADELRPLRERRRRIAEGTKFASREPAESGQRVTREVCRWLFHWALHHRVDDLFIVVHPKHFSFWTEVIGFHPFAGEKACGHVQGHPGVLLHFDTQALACGQSTRQRGLTRIVFRNPVDDAVLTDCYRPGLLETRLLRFQRHDLAPHLGEAQRLRELSADSEFRRLSRYLEALVLLQTVRAAERHVALEVFFPLGDYAPVAEELDALGQALSGAASWLLDDAAHQRVLLRMMSGEDRFTAQFVAAHSRLEVRLEMDLNRDEQRCLPLL